MSRHSLDETGLEEGQPWWFGCHEPERPPDEWAVWVSRCDACVLHLAVAANREPDRSAVHYFVDDVGGCPTTLRGSLEHALAWREREGYPPVRLP